MAKTSITRCLTVLAAFCALAAASAAAEPVFKEIPLSRPSGHFAAVAMGDIDKDGRAEILSGRREEEHGLFLFSFKNAGWTHQQLTADGDYGGVAIADITGDGLLDVLAVRNDDSRTARGLTIFKTSLSGKSMQFEPMQSPFTQAGCDDLAVADIESDGDLDIALATRGQGVKILLNNGNGTSFDILSLETDTYEETAIALGDLNTDKRLDVVATNHPGKNPRVFLCSASGSTSYSTAFVDGLNIPPTIGYKTAITDFNGDKLPDLAVGTRNGIKFFIGNGCTGPESDWWQPAPIPRSRETMQVCAADLDNDGTTDIVSSSASGILVLQNNGRGEFTRLNAAGLPEKGEYSGCCLFDWDCDKDLDLACSSFQGLGIRFFENLLVD